MKAITIRQPYAWAIAHGGKAVENRGRNTSHRGPVAIHAAGTWAEAGQYDRLVENALWPYLTAAQRRRVTPVDPAEHRDRFVYGAVIAVADLVDCHRVKVDLNPFRYCCAELWGQPYHHGPNGKRAMAHHLRLANVRVLAEPYSCPGKVLLPWELPAAATAEVERQLADEVRV